MPLDSEVAAYNVDHGGTKAPVSIPEDKQCVLQSVHRDQTGRDVCATAKPLHGRMYRSRVGLDVHGIILSVKGLRSRSAPTPQRSV